MKIDINFRLFVALWNRFQDQGTPRVHLRIAEWLEKQWLQGNRRLLLMAFRSCGKSTLVGLFCAWILWRNPDLRILVLAADLALARKMVRNVKRIIEKHPLTTELVPDQPDQWGSDRFTVNRDMELRDPSMLAKGVTTNITGTRADVIICDDVEVPKTCDTPYKREQMRERLLELEYILAAGGVQIYVGTPHSWYTIYAHEPRTEIGEKSVFLDGFFRLVIPVLEHGQPVWPERYTQKSLDAMRLKTGPNHFASQMMCEPVNYADSRLDTDSLQMYADEVQYSEAGRQPVLSIAGRKMVSASAWWDPSFAKAGGDRSIVAILYADNEGHYWLHHVAQLTVTDLSEEDEATQQCAQVAQLVKRFHLPSIAIETNGLGKFLPKVLRREIGRAGMSCTVREMTSRTPKDIRILEAFDAILAARALHVHDSVTASPFFQEMREWKPGGKGHDDALDAVAGALSLEPVRIGRLFGSKRQTWTGGSGAGQAKSDFDILE